MKLISIVPAVSQLFISLVKLISKEAPAIHMVVKTETNIPGIPESPFKACLPEAKIKRAKHFVILPVVLEEKLSEGVSSKDVIIHCSNRVFNRAEESGFNEPFPIQLKVRGCWGNGTATVLQE